MGVYIKGMEMPKVVGRVEAVITILKDGTAKIAISPADDQIGYWKEYSLVHVPPHGRLIDADAALRDGWTISRTYSASPTEMVYEAKAIDCLPTIIPAEEGE